MNLTSSAAARWSVSARATGEVLTATVPGTDLQLVLLGVPPSFTSEEVEGWLADLAGVARETSRSDGRTRAIPALLHHSLTGLLFSHAELWSGLDPMPCSLAFVTHEDGASFGWVGQAQVRVRVNGLEFSPQWVRVRDDLGREAMAASFAAGAPVEVDMAWGADASGAPLVTLAADWGAPQPGEQHAPVVEAPAASPFVAPVVAPSEAAPVVEPIVAAPLPPLELPSDLPQDQPSLHAPIADDAPSIEASAAVPSTDDAARAVAAPAPTVEETPHPVQRWLNRMVNWGGKPAATAPPAPAPPAPPAVEPTVAEAPTQTRPPVWRPDDAMSPPAAPQVTHVPTAPQMPPAITNEAPAPLEPEPEPPAPVEEAVVEKTREPKPDLSQALPMLRTKLLQGTPLSFEITHEPVGASSEGFGIPPLPDRAQPASPEAARSEGPPPLPATADVSAAPSGEGTMVIETHVGADREPVRREIASHVRTAPREGEAPLPGPPSLAGTFGPPAPHPAQPPRSPLDSALASAAPEAVAQPLAVPAPQVADTDVAWAQDPAAVAVGRPRRAWPLPDAAEATSRGSLAKRFAPWAGLVVVLMAAGWWLGHLDTGRSGGTPRWLKALGIGGASFEVVVNSHPPGAFISVDGKEVGQRTPATLDLKPGDHEVKLSMPDLGAAVFPVKGAKGDRTTLDLPLAGSLDIVSADASLPLNVAIDGKPMGFAPVRVDSIAPGLHEVTFSGPGMPAWVQSVQVGIHQNAQVLARPVTSPGTGVLQVQAVLNDETGSSPLSGAQVYVDGDLKGTTPATLEVSRGPHSLKVVWHGVSAPVQVIDLPGGNQRFATFNFGLDDEAPALSLIGGARSVSATQTSVVSAELDGLRPTELREGWLHVRSAEGVWRRYPLTLLPSPNGVALVGVFPSGAFDSEGRTRWYMSASSLQGDEYFTEIQSAWASGGSPAPKAKPKPAEQP